MIYDIGNYNRCKVINLQNVFIFSLFHPKKKDLQGKTNNYKCSIREIRTGVNWFFFFLNNI